MSVRFLDLRTDQNPQIFPRKIDKEGRTVNTSKIVKGRTLARRPETVTAIGIHQTACVFGPKSDREKAYRRALKIPAHVTAFRDGVFACSAPLSWYLYHGNDLNEFSLGLECEGHYAGRPDDPDTPQREDERSTWGGKPMGVDGLALETFCEALRWLVETGRSEGMPIEWIYAHRQASETRRSDPGYAIWQEVVIKFAVAKLGLRTDLDRTWRGGRPIPEEWDPVALGVPY